MNIGILQSAGIAGTIIDVALNHPEQQEVFTPVIYSKENGNDKNVSSDLKFGNISAVVVAPGSATEFNFPGSMTIYADDNIRVSSVFEGIGVPEDASAEVVAERVQKAWRSLQRDFLCSTPRIALLTTGDYPANELLHTIVSDQTQLGVGIFGPYVLDEFVDQQLYQHFDLMLTLDDAMARTVLDAVSMPTRTRLLAGLPIIMALTDYGAESIPADAETADLGQPALALRQAVYTVIAVCRNRIAYDEAHRDPLPKIYHERKDDSEKIRFAVKKPIA